MPQIKIVCPKCKNIVRVEYRTVGYGHGATEEALAIDRAIKTHQYNDKTWLCKPNNPE